MKPLTLPIPEKILDGYYSKLLPETLQSLASMKLENLFPSEEMLKDLVLRDTGKITNEEFKGRVIARQKELIIFP